MKLTIYNNLNDMTGLGEEWLIDEKDNVRAVFIDGNLSCCVYYIPATNKDEVTAPGVKNG